MNRIRQDITKFGIKSEDKNKALETIKKFVSNAVSDYEYFTWVNTSDCIEAKNLKQSLMVWGWDTYEDEDGNVIDITFKGSKLGDDFKLFKMIAPYVEKESFIQIMDEDGYMWRWIFDGKTCKEIYPKIIWDKHI